ncbi:MAG: hypothetical protein KC656_02080 [Myxococcales bacterium]|nr:hypothetical protein [Myxococcales bacterium]MCA9566593.1 hypothetical protein [Myxococcales bacterium]
MGEDLDAVRAAWTAQTVELPRFSPDELRAAAARFDRVIWRRNLIELAAGVLVVGTFGWMAWVAEGGVRVGAVLTVLGAVAVMVTLVRRGTPRGEVAGDCLRWRREELTRQRDLLASVWRWYLLPLVPGMVVMLVAMGRLLVDVPGGPLVIGSTGAIVAAVFASVAWMNQRAAAALQQQIDELGGSDA